MFITHTHTPKERVSIPRTTAHAIIITTRKHIAGHIYAYIINILCIESEAAMTKRKNIITHY